jgi:hypothetical protein
VLALRVVVFVAGALLVAATLSSAIKTFLVPRAVQSLLTRWVFVAVRGLFKPFTHPGRSYAERDRVMALYAPLSMLGLPVTWVALVILGFTGMHWAVGVQPLREAFSTSGSSLLTLGFARPEPLAAVVLSFMEAALGLGLVTLLISYLPFIYAAFSRRETAVALIDAVAGNPPSARELLIRHNSILGLGRLDKLWERWQEWFADLEESHTSIAALVFYRSPLPERSWVTAAGCVLDGASLAASCLDRPRSPEAELCIRGGYVALRRIADFFDIAYDPDPRPSDPISITREEFDELWNTLAAGGVPLKGDRDRAWRDFAGWRVNYDTVLRALATLTMAPVAPWSSDRPLALPPRSLFGRRRGSLIGRR